MLDNVDGATGINFQSCQVFHAQVQQLRIFEQRDPQLSQLESHKQEQDSSDVPIKSNRGSINLENGVAKGLIHHAQSITPQKWYSGNCAHQCSSGLAPRHAETTLINEWQSEHLVEVLVKPV
ncbi:hypothetical protein AVEN_145281-1 [Araneus ventricosus]|uniref:Uncharacterized protein n=1 Tax=Araneus ventricosus TaxID=182803 RepID=A0A4Y2H211_ARAVE|nr:hypothetical protein AVEN_145281-1 [Araneus ventricosus]